MFWWQVEVKVVTFDGICISNIIEEVKEYVFYHDVEKLNYENNLS